MANSYYTISITAPIPDIKAALIDKYGSGGVTVHYETTTCLIVSVLAISNKVLKFSGTRTATFYGDDWTSGTTITNPVQFSGYDSSGSNNTEMHLVLGDNVFFLCTLEASYNSRIAIIGKMTNDKYICIGMVGTSNSSYTTYHKGKNTTDNVDVTIPTYGNTFYSNTGKLYKQEIIIKRADGSVETKTDGSLATLVGLYNVSHVTSQTTLLKGANYLMSSINQYMSDAIMYLRTCLMAEF